MTPPPLRAAVIGHTGRGDFGHGLDIAFNRLPGVETVAVADPDPTGREKARQRAHAPRAYADYRQMLQIEQPQLVAIAPRWLGERVAMASAVAEAGAHIFCEKPLAATLAAADQILAACDAAGSKRAGVKIAVAHQGRLHPATLHTQDLLAQGKIGRLRLLRGYGKLDHRGGGEDLMVLGSHVLDLMRLFAGDAHWASGELLRGGQLATPQDVRPGGEEIGPIAGDGLRASFGFADGVIGLFESFADLAEGEQLFGLQLVGETGQLSLLGGFRKRLYYYPHAYANPGAADDQWQLLDVPGAAPGETPGSVGPPAEKLVQRANQRLVQDLLDAIAEDRPPHSSGQRARAGLELIQAVAAAHIRGGRVQLPLAERSHPLENWTD